MKIEDIELKKEILEKAKLNLKVYFVGLDEIIDEIISKITPWYLMPELIRRPLIVNLWGMTGVGKTDLVRKLVKYLNYQDRFEEIQLTVDMSGNGNYNIERHLRENENILLGKPYILLLDEIQRFRSVTREGDENNSSAYKDIWDLLSDGKLLPSVNAENISALIASFRKYEIALKKPKVIDSDDKPEDELDYRFSDDYYSTKQLKLIMKSSLTIEELMLKTANEKFKMLIDAVEDKSIYDYKDYTKGLIFISGNIDEAYEMAKSADDVDYDADLYHKLTKKINIIDIKRALKKRFKPEQIARFGNNNIIYPSLSKKSFETIIEKKIVEITDGIFKITGIQLFVSDNIKKLIYNNGVFPVQGTRPLFSTITDIIERNSLHFIYNILINKLEYTAIHLDYNNSKIIAKVCYINKKTKSKAYEDFGEISFHGDIDRIRERNRKNVDKKYGIAIHEAGHALMYALLFKVAPPQIISLTTNDYAQGYVSIHSTSMSKDLIISQIKIIFAGQAAEELIFGEKFIHSGSENDIMKATNLCAAMIRKYGMSEYKTTIALTDGDDILDYSINITNSEVKNRCYEYYKEALKLLKDNSKLLITLIDNLITKEIITSEEFVEICKNFGHEVGHLDSEEIIYNDLFDKYTNWKLKNEVK